MMKRCPSSYLIASFLRVVSVNASEYLVNQQIGIKVAFADKLKDYNDLCVKAYRLNGKFKGRYYNRLNQPTNINEIRPFISC